MISPRIVRAINNTRPYGTHRYDLFGPKIERRLTLFGRFALDLWVRLETDPEVLTYCERPLQIPDVKPPRLVDFWVRVRDGERLCVVLRASESTSAAVDRNKVVTTSSVNLSLHGATSTRLDKFPSIQVFTENELMLSPVSPHELVTNGRPPFVQDPGVEVVA